MRFLPQVRGVAAADPNLHDLTPFAAANLNFLAILGDRTRSEPLDLAPLANARTLARIDLLVPTYNYARLAALPNLVGLQLDRFGDVTALAELRGLTELELVGLRRVKGLRDLTPLTFLDHPRWFGLHHCTELVDATVLTRWAGTLRRVWLRDSPLLDPAPLAALTDLELLDLSGSAVEDLSVVAKLKSLRTLRLTDHHPLPDLAPLRELSALRDLWLYDSSDIDLSPLAGQEQLTVYLTRGQSAHGADLLGPGSRVVSRGSRSSVAPRPGNR
ncbi:hypothetical protein [Amycolatopsis pigmentata]|uniref:Leucine-rich repeat domain-containing protein n=1 Tax=Amycolatopsis pigmentata TaxID=450801 RepID=A0ABW5FYD8_9PSEU